MVLDVAERLQVFAAGEFGLYARESSLHAIDCLAPETSVRQAH